MYFGLKHRHHKTESAQGIVEFALILPLLLLVMYGIIEVGRLMVVYSSVGTASREAARYASASGDSENNVPYYRDCVGIRAAAQRMGILVGIDTDPISGDVQITYDEGHNPTPGATPVPIPTVCELLQDGDIELGDRVVVVVNATYEPLIPLVNFTTFPISSRTSRTILKDVPIEGTPISP